MTDQLQTRRDPIEDDEIDLLQLFGQIWAGKVTIMVFAIFGVLAGLFYVLNTPPTYQADSLLQLEEKASQLGLPES
ncbi:hypothetical protein DYI26_22905, partial [Halomonas litopenaei]|nr:hypothetical protein [Halomonas litopenaei]